MKQIDGKSTSRKRVSFSRPRLGNSFSFLAYTHITTRGDLEGVGHILRKNIQVECDAKRSQEELRMLVLSLSTESAGTLWIFKPFCPCQRERFLSIGKIQFALSKSIMFSFLFSTEKIHSVRSQFFNHRLDSLRICPASIPLNP